MTNFEALYIIVGLLIVILVEFFFLMWALSTEKKEKERVLEDMQKLVKALISKNANEYVMTASIDKVPTEEKPLPSTDEIPEETLSDEEFFKAISKQNKN